MSEYKLESKFLRYCLKNENGDYENCGKLEIVNMEYQISRYLDIHIKNAQKKRNSRLENAQKIINVISHNDIKKIYCKGKDEINLIINMTLGKFIKYSVREDTENKHNKIYRIEPGYNSGCCYECDSRPKFINKKVPSLYVQIQKMELNKILKIMHNMPQNLYLIVMQYL